MLHNPSRMLRECKVHREGASCDEVRDLQELLIRLCAIDLHPGFM